MATVYLVQDLRHGRPVALKLMNPELAASVAPRRFLREIQLAARLDHPHILPVYDSGEEAERLWYVMPYVEGGSLRDRLRRESRLPVKDAVRIARGIADALEYAHGRDVIHRDIKPENILLAQGHARLADFGIARAAAQATGEELTRVGTAVGTPKYMAPEQAGGESVDFRSDLYSLGCVLYEMLAGDAPYTGPSAHVIIVRSTLGPAPAVRAARPEVPEALEALITRNLSAEPADRSPSASAVAAELDESLTAPATPVYPPLPEHSTVGDEVKASVPPEEGYGERDDGNIRNVPRRRLPEGKIEPGMQLRLQTDQGQLLALVTAVKGDYVTIDTNHPLAGMTLHFEVKVTDVRDATAEELEHGHVHSPGDHHHH